MSCFLKQNKKNEKKKTKKKCKSYVVELKMAYHQFNNDVKFNGRGRGEGEGRRGGRGDEVNRSTSKVMMQA